MAFCFALLSGVWFSVLKNDDALTWWGEIECHKLYLLLLLLLMSFVSHEKQKKEFNLDNVSLELAIICANSNFLTSGGWTREFWFHRKMFQIAGNFLENNIIKDKKSRVWKVDVFPYICVCARFSVFNLIMTALPINWTRTSWQKSFCLCKLDSKTYWVFQFVCQSVSLSVCRLS